MVIRRHIPFIITSALCLPFLLHILIFLVGTTLRAGNINCPNLYNFLAIPFSLGIDWLIVSPIISLTLLTLISTSVVVAWFQKDKTRYEIAFDSIYSVVVLLYVGFVFLYWMHNS